MQPIHAVPTNIITGFLGAGKTSAILHSLQARPKNERWAVLVNEFGEIGVDGSLFAGSKTAQGNVFIREVPGGCMCCASGLPMQIALNMLLAQSRPHRLLIEPTGLGHPKEVLDVLTTEAYRELLTINKTVTLVDARKLRDTRYTEHDIFNQQIDIADIILGNKQDLYQADEKNDLLNYMNKKGYKDKVIQFTERGKLSPSMLSGESDYVRTRKLSACHSHNTSEETLSVLDEAIPDCGYLRVVGKGQGFQSIGWRFARHVVFSQHALSRQLATIRAERMKAVLMTDNGVMGYNLTPDGLVTSELDDCIESRIEIIARDIDNTWESTIMSCRL